MTALAKREAPALLRVEEAQRELAKCVRIDEAKRIRDQAAAIAVYQRQQRAGREAQNNAAEIMLRAERRLGELLKEQKAKGERRQKNERGQPASVAPSLQSLGIEKTAAKRWQEVAKVPEPTFEAFVKSQREDPAGEITRVGLQRTAKAAAMGVHYSSETDDWATPQDLFDRLDKLWGFELDVCASMQNAKCMDYYDRKADGLSKTWKGVCWMNPPYGDEIGKWVAKAAAATKGDATVVALLPSRTDTAWWHDYVEPIRKGPEGAEDVTFIRGRLKFGGAENSAPFPSCLVVFRKQVKDAWEPKGGHTTAYLKAQAEARENKAAEYAENAKQPCDVIGCEEKRMKTGVLCKAHRKAANERRKAAL